MVFILRAKGGYAVMMRELADAALAVFALFMVWMAASHARLALQEWLWTRRSHTS
ncbi:MAG: hypothetical protein Q8P75_01150 [bacterium]|nr:hypothetical protein [bacterium]